MHSYRELTAPELVTMFAKITGGYINKGRDARLISNYMADHNCGPTIVLEGMYAMLLSAATRDVPTLLRGGFVDDEGDPIIVETTLIMRMQGDEGRLPSAYFAYEDLIDEENAVTKSAWRTAKKELEAFNDDALTKPASLSTRSRAAR